MTCTTQTVQIDGETYVKLAPNHTVQEQPAHRSEPSGDRAVVIVDRGWIFAGDVTQRDGRLRLSRAVWVFRWESIGFDAVLKNPKSEKVQIRKLDHDVDLPVDAEVFRVPVSDQWGL